jgi:aromatic ring-opening dioxygenase LigB subunit
MTRVKSYDNQKLSDLEKNITEFLKKEDVKRLVNIKFTAISKNDDDKYEALIIYEVEEIKNNKFEEDLQI